jgi:sensor histidine kinase YesM
MTESELSAVRPNESIWRLIARELRSAPRNARRMLIVSFLSFDAGLAVAIWDLVSGTNSEEAPRLLSIFFSMFGLSFLVVAQVLHQVSQGLECRTFALPRANSNRYHRALVAVPLLAVIAAILLAMSIGMLWIPALESPVLIVFQLVIFLYLIYAARFVHATTRFLNRHAAEQAEAAAKAQAQATEAQLAALQSQMNPHFLFNALNTVAALVRINGRAAEATVEHLAEVLRRTLDRARAGSGTVADEIEYLKAYLAIEQERFGERLQVDWRLDPAVLSQSLPPLALQPLVENALRHGIGSRLEGGTITIEAVRDNGNIELSVSDNGIGFPPRHHEGTGLSNLRQRLHTLYGETSRLDIASTGAGSRVNITLPASNN